MDSSQRHFHEFCRTRSEQAFRALVATHSGLVYGTALRRLANDRAAAEDATQEVFVLLARKAPSLPEGLTLSSWLYRQCCRLTANYVRAESRRRKRELVAAGQFSEADEPVGSTSHTAVDEVDEALFALKEKEREALLLRFLEGREHRSVGAILGISEEAARKRVSRALERMRALLAGRGVAVSSATLVAGLGTLAPSPAPAAVLAKACAAALHSSAASGGTALGTSLLFPMLKSALAGLLVTSLIAGSLFVAKGTDDVGQEKRPAPRPKSSRAAGLSSTVFQSVPPYLRKLPSVQSLEAIIEEIKVLLEEPQNAVSSERLAALLNLVSIEDIPKFVELGNVSMSATERAACYEALFVRWVESDPPAAIACVGENRVWKMVDEASGHYLLSMLFHYFRNGTPDAARAWLVANWHRDYLKDVFDYRGEGPGFPPDRFVSYREYFAELISAHVRRTEGTLAALDFVDSLPSDGRPSAMEMMSGWHLRDHGRWHSTPPEQRMELHQRIREIPDRSTRRRISQDFWEYWAATQPKQVAEAVVELEGEARFDAALGLAVVYAEFPGSPATIRGTFMREDPEFYRKRSFREEMFQDALEIGLGLGRDRSEVVNDIASTIVRHLPDANRIRSEQRHGMAWLREHRSELDIDPVLSRQVGVALATPNPYMGTVPEIAALQLAGLVRDESLRNALSRACFRRLVDRDPAQAESFLGGESVPPETAAELRSILGEIR